MEATARRYRAGMQAEANVHNVLKQMDDITIIPNYTFAFDSAFQHSSHQLDFVAVSQKNIYIIEVKSYEYIAKYNFGDDAWTLKYHTEKGKERRQGGIDNPVAQNRNHRDRFIPYMPFVDPNHIIAVSVVITNSHILFGLDWYKVAEAEYITYKESLPNLIKYCEKQSTELIDVGMVLERLKKMPKVTDENHKRYCENIEKAVRIIRKSKKYPRLQQIQFQKKYCKKCGAKMHVKIYGGSLFWGCSNFPNCRCTDNTF